MANKTVNSAANDMHSLFDPKGFQDVFKTWADVTERSTSLAVEAGTRATDIASETTRDALSNLRDLTQARDEAAAYGEAYAAFVQKQAELFTRAAQAYAGEAQKVGSETADLATKAGEEVSAKVAANTEGAAQKARSAASKAA